MKNTRTALIALTAALTLGVTACGSSDGSDAKDDTKSSSASEKSGGGSGKDQKDGSGKDDSSKDDSSKEGSGEGSGGAGLSGAAGKQFKAVSAAIDAAEKKTGGTVYEVDDEDADGAWELDIAKGSKTIDAKVTKDGKVSVDDEDDDRDDDGDRAILEKAKVSVGDAVETALKKHDGTLEGAELEEEDGKAFWEVTVDDREVAVDVVTGKILTDVGGDTDDDGDDADDDNDDD